MGTVVTGLNCWGTFAYLNTFIPSFHPIRVLQASNSEKHFKIGRTVNEGMPNTAKRWKIMEERDRGLSLWSAVHSFHVTINTVVLLFMQLWLYL